MTSSLFLSMFHCDDYSQLILTLLGGFIFTWTIGLAPALLIRYIFVRHPISRKNASWIAAALSINFWFVFRILEYVSGDKPGSGVVWIIMFGITRWILSRKYVSEINNSNAMAAHPSENPDDLNESLCIPIQTVNPQADIQKPDKYKWFSPNCLSIWGFKPSNTSLIISVCVWILCIIFPPGGHGESNSIPWIIGSIIGITVGSLLLTFVIPGIIATIIYHFTKKSVLIANFVFCSTILTLVICAHMGYHKVNNLKWNVVNKPGYSKYKHETINLVKTDAIVALDNNHPQGKVEEGKLLEQFSIQACPIIYKYQNIIGRNIRREELSSYLACALPINSVEESIKKLRHSLDIAIKASNYNLSSLMDNGNPMAMIDGEIYNIGDRIDNYVIKSIDGYHVVLETEGVLCHLFVGQKRNKTYYSNDNPSYKPEYNIPFSEKYHLSPVNENMSLVDETRLSFRLTTPINNRYRDKSYLRSFPKTNIADTGINSHSEKVLVSETSTNINNMSPYQTTWFYGQNSFGTSTKMENHTFYNLYDPESNCITGSSMKINNTYFHNLYSNNGVSANGTTMNIGNLYFHHFSNSEGNYINGTSMRLGNMEFHNINDSIGNTYSGSTIKIGNMDFTNINQY